MWMLCPGGLCSIGVFVVWVECMEVLSMSVCGGAKSAEIGSRDVQVSTGQHAD